MKNKKACFIIPYFGHLPDTFPVYLKTCGHNSDFDWLIVTDDHTKYDYPRNVHVSYTTFDAFRKRIQMLYDFPIALEFPYKICDFRCAFGEIFAEELKEYEFWGHCDLDQYFGTIHDFITDEIMARYDKIFCLGHLSLFRNVPRINTVYKHRDISDGTGYRDCFSDRNHWIFDEWPAGRTCSNRIMKQNGIETYMDPECFCDLLPFRSRFRRTLFDIQRESWTDDKVKNEIYSWNKGRLFRHWMQSGDIQTEEILYVHIRQRKMDSSGFDTAGSEFVIVPNRIFSVDRVEADRLRTMLKQAERRSLLCPDERARQCVLLRGWADAARRRLKKLLTGRSA